MSCLTEPERLSIDGAGIGGKTSQFFNPAGEIVIGIVVTLYAVFW